MRIVKVIPVVVGALGTIPKKFDKWIEKIGIKIGRTYPKNCNTWDIENIKEGSRDLKRTENALVILGCLLQLNFGKLPVYNQN